MSNSSKANLVSGKDAPTPENKALRVERLLLAGLDHYFSGQHEHAINVWTRVAFLDRNNNRARAYIEQARRAVAERQRESEELLHRGIAAFHRGDSNEARELHVSGRAGEALALLDTLDSEDRSRLGIDKLRLELQLQLLNTGRVAVSSQ
jgi:hypothetical protein